MDRRKWESILTYFQAAARGHLVRAEVRRAREDFEDVVREIDGGLTHLGWRGTVIPLPHFSDTDGPLPRPSSAAKGLDVYASPSCPSVGTSSSPEETVDDRGVLLQKVEAERDDAHSKGHAPLSKHSIPSSNVRGGGQGQTENTLGDKDGGLMESTGDSTTAWSSMELDMNHGYEGPRQYCTPEALRLHRNTLSMELLWLQQAIDSRKKYLSLKDRLSVS